MRRCIFIILITLVSFTLCNIKCKNGLAYSTDAKCKSFISNCTNQPIQENKNDLSIIIKSDYAKGSYPNNVIFSGNVNVNHGNSHLQADKVQLHRDRIKNSTDLTSTLDALGNVRYCDNQVILKGLKGYVNLNTKDTNVWAGDYQIINQKGHGKADLIKQRDKNRYTILKNGSFTSCFPGSDIWSIIGSKVIYDRKDQIIKIWNARFKIGPIPIFYSPYLQLPIGNKRHSGFLIPNFKYSTSNYYELHLPYYINISPNLDATITPKYIYKNNNIIWQSELRYLTHTGNGFIQFDYLPSDKIHKNKFSTENDHHRWLIHWKHVGMLDQALRFNIDYDKSTTPIYPNIFNSKYTSNTNYTTQIFSANYSTQNFNASLSTKKFELLNKELNDNYAAIPQLDINWYRRDIKPFNFHLYGQIVHFINANSNMPKSIRLHLEPSINFYLSNNWTKVNTEVKLMATRYQQKNIKKYNEQYNTDLKYSINRILPLFTIDGKMLLKHYINFEGNNYIQILEPRIKYLYIPYQDQRKILNYNSSFLQPDYIGLFREKTYSSLDRISSTNQITTGITTRVYDKTSFERLNISIGQIYYLTAPRTEANDIYWQKHNKTGSLVWAGDTYWHITNHYGLRGELQYDERLNNITTGNGTIEYHRNSGQLIQFNYRYASQKYIQSILSNNANNFDLKEKISLIGIASNWSISNRWSILGSYYFDINENKSANQILGMKYNFCCCTARFGYERKFNGWDTIKNQSKYDNTISFNIELHSLTENDI